MCKTLTIKTTRTPFIKVQISHKSVRAHFPQGISTRHLRVATGWETSAGPSFGSCLHHRYYYPLLCIVPIVSSRPLSTRWTGLAEPLAAAVYTVAAALAIIVVTTKAAAAAAAAAVYTVVEA
eukprot:1181184-Prorocentrum_minimum.AAC.2